MTGPVRRGAHFVAGCTREAARTATDATNKTGAVGKALEPADIADQERAMRGFVVCR